MPFGTGSSDAILYRILHTEPDTAAVPELLRPLVEAALVKDPQRRPRADELLDQLTKPTRADRDYEFNTQAVLAQVCRRPRSRPLSRRRRTDPCCSSPVRWAPAVQERGGQPPDGHGRRTGARRHRRGGGPRAATRRCGRPADGQTWTTIGLDLPPGASAAVLQQVAIDGDHVVALSQETKAGEPVPFAEFSTDGGASWQEPFRLGRSRDRRHRAGLRLGRLHRGYPVRQVRPAGRSDLDLRHRVLLGFHPGQRPRRRRNSRGRRAGLIRLGRKRHRLDRHSAEPSSPSS